MSKSPRAHNGVGTRGVIGLWLAAAALAALALPSAAASNSGCPLPPPDGDADGVPDSFDGCPTQAGPASNGGCPLASVQPPSDDAYAAAKSKLAKAKGKLKLLRRADASRGAITRAAKQVKRAKAAVKVKCRASRANAAAQGRPNADRFVVLEGPRPR